MQFVGFIGDNQEAQNQVSLFSRDRRPLHDFYIRRYYNIKYGIQAISAGCLVWVGKTFVENIIKTRFYRLSPWIQLTAALFVYKTRNLPQYSDYKNVILATSRGSRQKYLKQYQKKFKFNSQFYH